MAGSAPRDVLAEEYQNGASITDLAKRHGMCPSTVRRHVLLAGVLLSRAEGVKRAQQQGKLGVGLRGKKRTFTEDHKKAIQAGRSKWGEQNAVGYSAKANGYVEITRGENKFRSVHVVIMENRIGRRLRKDETVHHIDGDRSNNDENNLALITRSGHARLHRIQDAMAGKFRERDENGRFR